MNNVDLTPLPCVTPLPCEPAASEGIWRGDMEPKTILTPASGHNAGPGTEASSQKVAFRNKNYIGRRSM